MLAELPKSYAPADAEGQVQSKWEAANAFHCDPADAGEPYCIVIPPPNVTAPLHLGHALNNTIQDCLIRYHRMCGFNTLYMPGTDHAGIATQTVVEKRLLQQGKKRTDFSRQEFVAKVQAWKDQYEVTIIEQLKAMGCSCDWQRQRFTMDEICARSVRQAFFQLFKDGLIYRGKRLVNWDPVTLTALADDEVEMQEVAGHMWYLKYPLAPLAPPASAGGVNVKYIVVATTRPETMLGDTAIAMNPKDPRAKDLVGKTVLLPIVNREIPIVADDYVVMPTSMGGSADDPKAEFATGFLKVTPAHDQNDWDIGQRHDLEIINILAPDASISTDHGWVDCSDEAKQFVGLSREDARQAVVEWFKKNDLLVDVKEYSHSVGHSYRSHVPIEPYLSDQWYVAVSKDRLCGEALRAQSDKQFEGNKPDREAASGTSLAASRNGDNDSLTSGTGVSPVRTNKPATSHLQIHRRNLPHWELGGSTYFVTFRLASGNLSDNEKQIVLDSCRYWHGKKTHVHLVTVMPDHIHMLITPQKIDDDNWYSLSELLQGIKSYSAHEINAARESKGTVWQEEYFDRIVRNDDEFYEKYNYMLQNPVKAGLVDRAEEYRFTHRPGNDLGPHGRDARATEESGDSLTSGTGVSPVRTNREGDSELSFYPARYAKTYQSWHENLRDWCISRQLWWGHRIPVWRSATIQGEKQELSRFEAQLDEWELEDRIATQGRELEWFTLYGNEIPLDTLFVCLRNPDDDEIAEQLEKFGMHRDPDVLDTWFSSALWPISTMGWPDPKLAPETEGLLETFNPSSVLCTGRDIITLWVSRMVMFNRYFREGTLPFRDVYIHTMIQDGHGQRMSKSLGNGVDPRDIIHTHGADAMRYVLLQMATTTQDVRLSVDMICPHCQHTFHPEETRSPTGYRVATPQPKCPKCSKSMVSSFGAASGLATPSDEEPLARITSNKFDLGRNFANKLWNATRFALGQLDGDITSEVKLSEMPMVDRWIIARLHNTLRKVEAALSEYQFNVYADCMYDFIWGEFCGWYLEAIKPTVKDSHAQQQVLRTVLNATLRMLHPICPFVTETLWPHVQATGDAGFEGISLPASELLATAAWPTIDESIVDKQATLEFAKIQELIDTIRNIRGEHNVAPRKRIGLFASAKTIQLIEKAQATVEALAGLTWAKPITHATDNIIKFTFAGEEQALADVIEKQDKGVERDRLQKLIADLTKSKAGLTGRLSNPGYVDKAPAHLVDETKAQLVAIEADLEAAQHTLGAL